MDSYYFSSYNYVTYFFFIHAYSFLFLLCVDYRPRQKILICGLPDDISPCLDYAMIAKPGMIDYSSLIIASTDVSLHNY